MVVKVKWGKYTIPSVVTPLHDTDEHHGGNDGVLGSGRPGRFLDATNC
jgi:hypothetical protein